MSGLKEELKLHKVMEKRHKDLANKIIQGKCLGKFGSKVFKDLAKQVKAKASTPAEEEELPEEEVPGLRARVCDEEFVQMFGHAAEIVKQTAERVFLQAPEISESLKPQYR